MNRIPFIRLLLKILNELADTTSVNTSKFSALRVNEWR
jgi:hypothetical protein